MKFRLVESFDKLNSGIIATDSPFTIKNLIINKPSTYRILYDEAIDTYFIGDGELLTHFDLLCEAYNSGYYYQVEDYIDELGGIQFYYRDGENKYLYFLVFDNANNWDVGDDGLDTIYNYDFGNMLSRACNFSDTELYKILNSHIRESLDVIELKEEVLNEKKWVQLSATRNGNPVGKPFYFYAVDGTSSTNDTDVQNLIPYIIGKHRKGSYKQQLNPKIVKELKSEYDSCVLSGDTFDLAVINHSVNPKSVKDKYCITLTDRDLRTTTRDTVSKNKIGNNQTESDISTLQNNYLIHHKKKGERNNSFKNIALISRAGGIEFAHAIHKMIEDKSFPLSVPPKVIPIYEFDTTTKKWTPTHTVTIDIK